MVKKTKALKKKKSCWQLYVMLLPAVLYLLVFAYKPMYGVIIAFKKYTPRLGIIGSKWNGLDNFHRLFSSFWFPTIIKNTLTISILSLLISFPIPIILALLFNEIKGKRLRNTIQTVTYAPHFISIVVACGMIVMFLNPSTGVINQLIVLLGGKATPFLQVDWMFKWIYVLSGVWQQAGWSSIIYYAALSGVDKNLLEAASLDGATKLQKIIYVNLPVIVPTMITLLILNCGSVLNVGYEKIFLLQNDLNLPVSEVISTYVYRMGLEKGDLAFSTAVGLLNSVVNAVILLVVNQISKKAANTGLF